MQSGFGQPRRSGAEGGSRHTVQYQSQYQASPPPDRSAAPPVGGSPYNRYVVPPSGSPSGIAPPPGTYDQAPPTMPDAGNTLRREFETGGQDANSETVRIGRRVMDGATDVGQGFSNQFRDFTSSTEQQLQATGGNHSNAARQTVGAVGDGLQQGEDKLGFGGTAPPPLAGDGRYAQVPTSVSPPPLSPAATSSAPRWTSGSASSSSGVGVGAGVNSQSNGLRPIGAITTPSGWTMLGNDTAPPPLLAPSAALPAPACRVLRARVTVLRPTLALRDRRSPVRHRRRHRRRARRRSTASSLTRASGGLIRMLPRAAGSGIMTGIKAPAPARISTRPAHHRQIATRSTAGR